jgi:hypothetical protein
VEPCDPLDHLARVWHLLDLGHALGCASVALVVEQSKHRVSNRGGRQLVLEKLAARSGGDDSIRVGVLVGALWEYQQRRTERERT